MKTEEIKKLIQKVGPLRLGAVVICGILLILISYGVSFEKAGGESGDKESAAVETDVMVQQNRYREQMKQELIELLRRGSGQRGSDADAESHQ